MLTSSPKWTLPNTRAVSAMKFALPLLIIDFNSEALIMSESDYLLTNIAQIHGILDQGVECLKGSNMQQINKLEKAYIKVENGLIAEYGSMQDCPNYEGNTIDLSDHWVMPAFVDSHTHMVFATSRHNEYVMRLQGKTYEDIASEGGGILNSALRLQEMSEDDLYNYAKGFVEQAMLCGTGALEIKSGYGLSVDAELKMLRVIKRLKAAMPIVIKATFLGAHAMPKAYQNNREAYIQLIINEMLPVIAEQGLADFIDVFCDKGFYTPEETQTILSAAQHYGLPAKIHGNELGLTGGVQVAVANKALSVDHLEHLSEQEIDCLLQSDTMPVALPGSSFFLKIPYTPARRMVDAGLPVAIASDFNPGSSPHYNLFFTWSLACLYNGLLPEEGFNALTINAAKAMGLQNTHGSITVGKTANLMVTKVFNHMNELPYWFAQNHCVKTFKFK